MNREQYDHVTSVINWPIEQWYVDWVTKLGKTHCNKVGKQARNVGTRVDNLIMKYYEDGKDFKFKKSDNDEVKSCIKGFKLWNDRYQPEPIHTQLTQYDDERQVVGTLDFMAVIGGLNYIVDIKCATKVTYQYAVQVAKYLDMAESNGIRIDGVGILRLDKLCNTYQWAHSRQDEWLWDIEECIEAFEGLLKWYRLVKNKGESI